MPKFDWFSGLPVNKCRNLTGKNSCSVGLPKIMKICWQKTNVW